MTYPLRKVVRWDAYQPPTEWSGLLECGHTFGKDYSNGDSIQDGQQKDLCERHGVACVRCQVEQDEIKRLEKKLQDMKQDREERLMRAKPIGGAE